MWLELILTSLVFAFYHFSQNVKRLHFHIPLCGFHLRVNSAVNRLYRRQVAFAPRAAKRRRLTRRRRRNLGDGRSLQGTAPRLPFVPDDFVTSCNTRQRTGDRGPEGPAPPSAPTAPITPISTRPLSADAKVFHPRASSSALSPTSSASSSSQASSPIPSLTSTTVSPFLSMPGKVLNISNTDLRYRSQSTMAGTPPPRSPPGFNKYDCPRMWSDEERIVRLNHLADRMMD